MLTEVSLWVTILGVIVQIVLAGAALWIAIVQHKQWKHEECINDLKKMHRSVGMERSYYMAVATRYYAERYQRTEEDIQIEALVFRQEWMRSEPFPLLAQIQVENGGQWRGVHPKMPYLPAPEEHYAENLRMHCDIMLWDNPLYGLGGVTVGDNGDITFSVLWGTYFDFCNTCECLSGEMAYHRRVRRERELGLCGQLRNRDALGDILNFDAKRFAGIGINTLTILHGVVDDSGLPHSYFLMHKRSSKLAEGAGTLHVVPAGSYQPPEVLLTDQTMKRAPDPLVDTVVREFGEELLIIDEMINLCNSDLLYRNNPWAEEIRNKTQFLGVGLNPLNTKAEVLTCIQITLGETGILPAFRIKQDVEKFLSDHYEGTVSLKPFHEDMLLQLRDNRACTAAFRQILRVVLAHPDAFRYEKRAS